MELIPSVVAITIAGLGFRLRNREGFGFEALGLVLKGKCELFGDDGLWGSVRTARRKEIMQKIEGPLGEFVIFFSSSDPYFFRTGV